MPLPMILSLGNPLLMMMVTCLLCLTKVNTYLSLEYIMKKIETIVITGGIGSGKSSVIESIKRQTEKKVSFFNFDDFTEELYEREDVKKFLNTLFGTTDKKEISDIVLNGEESETTKIMREELNEFFFSLVEEKFIELVNRKPVSTLIIEMPMFFEMKKVSPKMQMVRSKLKVIVVAADDEVRIARVKNRDGFTEDKIRNIMSVQEPQQYKIEKADYVIDNTHGDCDNNVIDLMKNKFMKVFFNAEDKSADTKTDS